MYALFQTEVEPATEFSGRRLLRPPIQRNLDRLVLEIDESGSHHSLLGKLGVHSHRSTQFLRGVHQFLRPPIHERIPRHRPIVALGDKVNLNLLQPSDLRSQMSNHSQKQLSSMLGRRGLMSTHRQISL